MAWLCLAVMSRETLPALRVHLLHHFPIVQVVMMHYPALGLELEFDLVHKGSETQKLENLAYILAGDGPLGSCEEGVELAVLPCLLDDPHFP